MAAGDKAVAKGWPIYPGNQDRRQGYQNDNELLDRLADEEDARKLGDPIVQQADPGAKPDGTVWISWV